jgi:hypothetical protein
VVFTLPIRSLGPAAQEAVCLSGQWTHLLSVVRFMGPEKVYVFILGRSEYSIPGAYPPCPHMPTPDDDKTTRLYPGQPRLSGSGCRL